MFSSFGRPRVSFCPMPQCCGPLAPPSARLLCLLSGSNTNNFLQCLIQMLMAPFWPQLYLFTFIYRNIFHLSQWSYLIDLQLCTSRIADWNRVMLALSPSCCHLRKICMSSESIKKPWWILSSFSPGVGSYVGIDIWILRWTFSCIEFGVSASCGTLNHPWSLTTEINEL